jgi:hypothetical protein
MKDVSAFLVRIFIFKKKNKSQEVAMKSEMLTCVKSPACNGRDEALTRSPSV